MDLREAIVMEHSKTQTDRIVRYVGSDKKKFAELMKLFLKGDRLVAQRAAWPLSYCVEKHPGLIQPYFKQILDYLDKPGKHEAVNRNIVRLLQYADIPKKFQGRVMNSCFEFITDHETAVAVKAFSLTVLEHLADNYPEIKAELKLVIEERWEHETIAFRTRAKKILKRI